jgi:hypothetical protein
VIFGTPALLFAASGFACIAFVTYGIGFWGAPFFIRQHGVSAARWARSGARGGGRLDR